MATLVLRGEGVPPLRPEGILPSASSSPSSSSAAVIGGKERREEKKEETRGRDARETQGQSRRTSGLATFERQRLAESAVRTVYVHAHMDEDTFDCSRAMMCPDLAPAGPGKLVPACTYNLLYRMRDERFYAP